MRRNRCVRLIEIQPINNICVIHSTNTFFTRKKKESNVIIRTHTHFTAWYFHIFAPFYNSRQQEIEM